MSAVTALAWDHNAYYRRLVLRHVPPDCGTVLDVGCGAGTLAAALAQRVPHVDALDVSPEMIGLARRATPPNVVCSVGDAVVDPLPRDAYDAIVSMSALHHMPLARVLPRLAAALRPGGTLVVVALPRRDLLREAPVEIAAAVGHRVLGATFATARVAGSKGWYAFEDSHDVMPVHNPLLTTRQVRRDAAAILDGVRVRRLVFWRYVLLWRKPAADEATSRVRTEDRR